ncbi:hypothetical protein BJI67_00215 [Acidihalobacter aeolianus]|uniref:TNase-like domain-containing protein n=1 Tax=Acidihalobacter aeolianus TaxID=2792603 RepID=A0A1D8K442_9GAMM|nr:hypothetical protein BJI67_00215 [Acidihalobacter aeolianus]
MPGVLPTKRALLVGALFVCLAGNALADCGTPGVGRIWHVQKVFDGDTVLLDSGVHLRLIGLDAPEVAHREQAAQPYAEAAKSALQHLLAGQGWRLRLRYGREHHDRYGRTLAHAYLPDGTNLSAALLRRGLATALAVPPNVSEAACYQRAENMARQHDEGLWSLPRYRPVASTALPKNARGFHIVRGRVAHVGFSRRAVWLDLEGHVAVRIDRRDLGYFRGIDLRGLRGRVITVRGWVHGDHGGTRVSVRYPLALDLKAGAAAD